MNEEIKRNQNVDAMSNNYDFSSLSSSKDEIDLFELFSIIVKSKKTILWMTLLFAIVAAGVCYLLPQKWTSTAVITSATDQQLQVLDKLSSELTVLGINIGIDSSYLLGTFEQSFDSADLREKYLINSDYFRLKMKENPIDKIQQRILIENIVNNNILSNSSLDKKDKENKHYNFYTLSYSAETPQDAYNLLQGYIDYVNAIVNKNVKIKIQRAVDIAKLNTDEQYRFDLLKAKNNLSVNIEKLKIAIAIANVAAVKTPVNGSGTFNDDDTFPITIGSYALNKKLESLQTIGDITTINADLLNRKLHLNQLNMLAIPKLTVMPFQYLQQASSSIKKNSPKSTFIVLLSVFMGLFCSVGYVLIRHFVKERKNQLAG
ncbi:LPS O-antigen length regulator Wzz(fepE) [Candidatus Fukatsuia symbiotica]|uniref:LPS O-antigen length regulator n=1 Tax=Candidatus Fukatsuia symbiotica TaxID=1878942 RepID=A0A2U8I2R1_9GAMM|nr:LPS O-antigen length regulator Wzz(fepE) [Candidatus Fukatsuia symbiotica]AWK13391.1 LPS O-antigen length regulator [Candidatus Fukatsuia symbiotica]MEA9444283.1 LPS O-antigen length regulator Wzz(fepE) [Candidatus Fukatsuia symbiotica]